MNTHILLERVPGWLTAIGTISATVVALYLSTRESRRAASKTYFEKAEAMLRTVVEDFLEKTLENGRPLNDRRHWLNFARGVLAVQELAQRIKTPELKVIWRRTEHYWRERVYDTLGPQWGSYPADYYGYTGEEKIKNIAQSPTERQPLAEQSLVFVYRWIQWPEDLPDPLDRNLRFTDEELERYEVFGPRGLAEQIRIRRSLETNSQPQSQS